MCIFLLCPIPCSPGVQMLSVVELYCAQAVLSIALQIHKALSCSSIAPFTSQTHLQSFRMCLQYYFTFPWNSWIIKNIKNYKSIQYWLVRLLKLVLLGIAHSKMQIVIVDLPSCLSKPDFLYSAKEDIKWNIQAVLSRAVKVNRDQGFTFILLKKDIMVILL